MRVTKDASMLDVNDHFRKKEEACRHVAYVKTKLGGRSGQVMHFFSNEF
jgi:putative heme iron utilization protein